MAVGDRHLFDSVSRLTDSLGLAIAKIFHVRRAVDYDEVVSAQAGCLIPKRVMHFFFALILRKKKRSNAKPIPKTDIRI